MNPSPSAPAPPKIIAGSKSHTNACSTCTFLNPGDAKVCGMCQSPLTPPTHDVQANGMWRCGSCSNLNRKGLKECHECHTPFYSSVTSTAPSQIFCSRCGFLNDGDNIQCVQCDNQLRSALEKIGTDLRDSTNFLARDMGVNINVKCPGCMVVCFVPPATAGLRCGSCHTYFASPTVGEVTNFHMTRLASSISSSFRGFFSRGSQSSAASQEAEVPVGRLLAIGTIAQQQQSSSEQSESTIHSLGSSQSSYSAEGDYEEEKQAEPLRHEVEVIDAREWKTAVAVAPTSQRESPRRAQQHQQQRHHTEVDNTSSTATVVAPLSPTTKRSAPVAFAVAASTPIHSRDNAAPMALTAADPQDMFRVEGDIVEL